VEAAVSRYIKSLSPGTTDLYMFSDTCGGQNRNIQMSIALMHACQTTNNLKTVTQYMIESGHSQMECDSVHSTIETACKYAKVYSPMDYYAIVGAARHEKKPYKVTVMETGDFLDYKSLVSSYVKNRSKCDDSSSAANWMKMKVLRYSKDKRGKMEFASYNYDGPFYTMTLNAAHAKQQVSTSTRQLRGRKVETKSTASMPVTLPCLYSSPVLISKVKYDDLISLCDSLAIITDHHPFYRGLAWKHSAAEERLPEPDIEEDTDEDTEDGDDNAPTAEVISSDGNQPQEVAVEVYGSDANQPQGQSLLKMSAVTRTSRRARKLPWKLSPVMRTSSRVRK